MASDSVPSRGGDGGYVDVNGASLYVEQAGEGAPVALVHNGIGDLRTWDDLFPVLSRSHRAIRHDMRGWGKSICPSGAFSHSRDLAALLQALDAVPAVVVGSSFGGLVAIDTALERPECVRALVLIGAALGGYRFSAALDEFELQIEAAMEREDIPAAAEVDLRVWVDGPSRSPEQVDPVVRERARVLAEHVYEVIPQQSHDAVPLPPDTPAIARLGDIAVPTLVIVGDLDQPDMLNIADLVASHVPGARLEVVDGTAHLPHMERPDVVNRLVLDFLVEIGA